MAKAVRSNGANQNAFNELLAHFDKLEKTDIDKAHEYFSGRKENGRMRADDLNLPSLCEAIAKMYARFDNAPAYLKYHLAIKLEQGKAYWMKQFKGLEDHADNNGDTKAPKKKFAWE